MACKAHRKDRQTDIETFLKTGSAKKLLSYLVLPLSNVYRLLRVYRRKKWGSLPTQLDAPRKAIASGEPKVAYDGREVVYRSMADLVAARNLIKADLQELARYLNAPR